MIHVLKKHWPEYLMEAAGLGLFMVSAGVFATILEYPEWPLRGMISDPLLRRILMGLAMGITAVLIITSPWGKRSGAHINPAVTLTFWRLGKVSSWDALFYIFFQFAGAFLGVTLVFLILGLAFAHPFINFVVTIPGPAGAMGAFITEVLMSFILMGIVLLSINRKSLNAYTGHFAGILVALFIIAAAPLSGMSINPARSFASALVSGLWTAFWVYMLAPPFGMLAAAEVYIRIRGKQKVYCAKLHHENSERCIFDCHYDQVESEEAGNEHAL